MEKKKGTKQQMKIVSICMCVKVRECAWSVCESYWTQGCLGTPGGASLRAARLRGVQEHAGGQVESYRTWGLSVHVYASGRSPYRAPCSAAVWAAPGVEADSGVQLVSNFLSQPRLGSRWGGLAAEQGERWSSHSLQWEWGRNAAS